MWIKLSRCHAGVAGTGVGAAKEFVIANVDGAAVRNDD